jgi:hypothetical protein
MPVESTQLSEYRTPNQHAGAGNHRKTPRRIHGRMIGSESGVNVARITVLTNGHARVLNCSVRIQQFGTNNSSLSNGIGVGLQCFQPAGSRNRIVVQKNNMSRFCLSRAVIAAHCESSISSVPHDLNSSAVTRQHLRCGIR